MSTYIPIFLSSGIVVELEADPELAPELELD